MSLHAYENLCHKQNDLFVGSLRDDTTLVSISMLVTVTKMTVNIFKNV